MHESLIRNRELNPAELRHALAELEQHRVVSTPDPEETDYQDRNFEMNSPWTQKLTSWRRIAEYLDRTHQTAVSKWLDGLDYSVFDELPAAAGCRSGA